MMAVRTVVVMGLLLGAVLSVMLVAFVRNTQPSIPALHVDHRRVGVAERVADAVHPAGHVAGRRETLPLCTELEAAASQWQAALTSLRARLGLPAPIVVDAGALLEPSRTCIQAAQDLRASMRDVLPLFAARERWLDGRVEVESRTAKGAIVQVFASDAATRNPFALLPLQVYGRDGALVSVSGDLAGERWMPAPAGHRSIDSIAHDDALASAIVVHLVPARYRSTRVSRVGARVVPAAARLELGLDASLQRDAAAWVRCFAGLRSACIDAGPLPLALRSDPRLHDSAHGPRSPVASLVVAELDTGRIVAMAGAVSDCARRMMERDAASGNRRHLAFGAADDRCAQYPDRRHRYLLSQHASLWVVPPGSFAKVPVAVACLAGRAAMPGEPGTLRGKLARSDDNRAFQRLGLACADSLRATWRAVATPASITYGAEPWAAAAALPLAIPEGSLLEPDAFEEIANRWRSSRSLERELGPETTARYLRSAAVASLSIGGGGMGMNTVAIAQFLRDLALRAGGQTTAPHMHLVRDLDAPVPGKDLRYLDRHASAATLEALGAVTSATVRGTARDACARVLADCPLEGLADFAGKTGTADFMVNEQSPHVKDGVTRLPAKVFGAVFVVNGRRYVAASMVLRGRDSGERLELQGNAAAELVLLAYRSLRDSSGNR